MGLFGKKKNPQPQPRGDDAPGALSAPGLTMSAEKIVILLAGDDPPRDEVMALVGHAETAAKIDALGVPVRVKAYDVPPESITRGLGMAVLVRMEHDGEVTCGAASRAWVREVDSNGKPRVIIVVYRQSQAPPHPEGTRAGVAPPGPARLDSGHPVHQLQLGMGPAAVTSLLGDEYLSISGSQYTSKPRTANHIIALDAETLENVYWLYSGNPPGHDIQLIFRRGTALASIEVKRKNADGSSTSVMKMDQ